MKLLLDECVTRHVKRDFVGHVVFTVDDAGFKGLKNGDLLRAAASRFDVIVGSVLVSLAALEYRL